MRRINLKKRMCFILLALLSTVSIFAQSRVSINQYQDVIYLKNGSIIHGLIVEQVPNESIKIQTNDGNVFVYSMSDVLKMAKESILADSKTVSKVNTDFNRKSPGVSLLCSFLIPGLGQIINEDYGKGIGFFIGYSGLISAAVGTANDDPDTSIICVGCASLVWVISMIEAPISANNYNKKHESMISLNLGGNKSLNMSPDISFNKNPLMGYNSRTPSYGVKMSLSF